MYPLRAMIDLGPITLSVSNVFFGVLWFGVGVLCTVIPGHRSLWLAVSLVAVVQLVPALILVNPPTRTTDTPAVQFFWNEGDLNAYWQTVIVPLLGAVAGALVGELLLPAGD